jgi:hypothetical protein
MKEVKKEQVLEALQAVGVQPGDGLLVHSAIQFLGRPAGGVGLYFEALCEAVNCQSETSSDEPQLLIPNSQFPTGTLAFPTFNFAFARGESYDPQNTPSVGMGVLSEFVRQQPGVRRTPHRCNPGGRRRTPGPGGRIRLRLSTLARLQRMLALDFNAPARGRHPSRLDAPLQRTACECPYRYWKEFTGR